MAVDILATEGGYGWRVTFRGQTAFASARVFAGVKDAKTEARDVLLERLTHLGAVADPPATVEADPS